MVRDYVARVEMNAKSSDALTQETQEWISWARKKADWYDPTIHLEEDELLKDIDLENLKINEPYYSGMNFYHNSEYTQRERSFWKPFWAK
jgi:hypothetical protein